MLVNRTLRIEAYSPSGNLVPSDISPGKSPSERGCPSGIYLHLTPSFYRATMMYRPRQLPFSFYLVFIYQYLTLSGLEKKLFHRAGSFLLLE